MLRLGLPLFVLVTVLVFVHGATLQVADAGGVTVAVFWMSPVAPTSALPVTLIVTDVPLASVTLLRDTLLVVPLDGVPQLAPVTADVQFHADTLTDAGTVSVTDTPVTLL